MARASSVFTQSRRRRPPEHTGTRAHRHTGTRVTAVDNRARRRPDRRRRRRAAGVMFTSVVFVSVLALALHHARVRAQDRCTYGASGDLVGHEVYVNRSSLAPGAARRYSLPVPALPGCSLNGVLALVCDTFAPEVDVGAALAAVEVRRLGPRLRPLSVDLYLYCDPLPRPRPPPRPRRAL